MTEDIASIVRLDHGEVTSRHFVSETVEGSNYVRMRLGIDPASDVFIVWDLPDHKLLSEVLVIYHISSVTNDMFYLNDT